MRNDIHKRRARRFLPAGMDSLEDRVVLSAGMSARAAMAAAVRADLNHNGNNSLNGSQNQDQNGNQNQGQNGGQNQGQQTPLVDQVIDQLNPVFAQFATQYYQLQGAYFASLDSPPGAGAIDLTTFHNQAGTLVDNLTQQVLGVIDAVPGGGGLLDGYLKLRLDSDLPGSLRHELTSLPAIGTNGLDKTGFGLTASAILQDALLSTQNFTRLYDQSLLFTTFGFFNGSLRFFNKSLFTSDLPQTTPGGPTATDQAIDNVNRYFSTFAQDYQNALGAYFDSIGTGTFGAGGDIQTFRASVDQALKNLETDVLNAINSVPGGAGPLSRLLNIRLSSDIPGSLRHDLMNLPPVGTSGLGTTGFALAGNTYLRNTLLGTQNAIRLYSDSLSYVANGFFDEFSSRFLRNNPTGNGNGGISNNPTGNRGAGNTGGQLSARQVGTGSGNVRVRQLAFLPTGPFNQGNINNSINGFNTGGFFSSAPAGFNVNNGFGGLGSGFNFAGTGTGFPFGNVGFGTGFGAFNVNNGFNPLLGINPTLGTGLGGSFGIVGPSFSPGFSGLGTTGTGFGFGVNPGFGGFFF